MELYKLSRSLNDKKKNSSPENEILQLKISKEMIIAHFWWQK